MKARLLIISSIASLFLLSWLLDAKLQPQHCINSSILRYAVDYKSSKSVKYSKRDGYHKPLNSSLIPSCEFNEYFKHSDDSIKSAYSEIKNRIESLESFTSTLPKPQHKIDLIVRDDQTQNLMITPTRVEISLDLISEKRLLEKSLLLSWLQQSYITMPLSYQNLLTDFLFSTLEGELSMGSELVEGQFIMLTTTQEYCRSKYKSVSHYQVCNVLENTKYKLKIDKNEKYFNFSRSYRPTLEELWASYESSGLIEKLATLSRFKTDEFRLAFLHSINRNTNKGLAWQKNMSKVLKVALEVKSQTRFSVPSNIVTIDLNKASNQRVPKALNPEEFKFKFGHLVGNDKLPIVVLLKCGEVALTDVVEYSDFAVRLMHIKNCSETPEIKWAQLSNKNLKGFFQANKRMKFTLYHLPSLQLAAKHSRLQMKDSEAFMWESVDWDKNLQVHKPHAVYDAITYYRN